jgi:hypothetical protein
MIRSAARIRICLAVVVGLLFCTLATLELPELVNLSDDTSNDYSLTVFQNYEVEAHQKQAPQFSPTVVFGDAIFERSDVSVPDWHSNEVLPRPDLLRMICILRT